MVPPELASQAFKLFMTIPRDRIEQDIEGGDPLEVLERYEAARQKTLAFYRTEEEHMTAEQCAEHMHAEMVMGCLGLLLPPLDQDIAFHLLGAGARGAARTALFAADKTGELGKLNEEMDRIRAEDGREDFDELGEDEWPQGYLPLAERAGELLGKIEKMMVIDVLKRYGKHDEAELFEKDEEAFDERVGRGGRKLLPEKPEPKQGEADPGE